MSAVRSLLFASLAWCAASSRDGLSDAFAAYQQRVQEHQLASPKPTVKSSMDLLPAVEEIVIDELKKQDRTLQMAATENRTAKSATSKVVRIAWTLLHSEKGTTASLSASTGCGSMNGGKRVCQMPVSQAASAAVNVELAKPLYKDTTFEMVLNIKAMFITSSEKMKCAACGEVCKGKFMGYKWEMEMPPCPITGTWTAALPVDMLDKVPVSFSAFWDTTIRRKDNSIVVEYHTDMRT